MLLTLFIVGLLTALGCGFNVVTVERSTGLHELAWVLGGLGGAAIVVLAIILRQARF